MSANAAAKTAIKSELQGWGDGSLGGMFAVHAQALSLGAQHPCTSGAQQRTPVTSKLVVRDRRLPEAGPASRSSWLVSSIHVRWETLPQKTRERVMKKTSITDWCWPWTGYMDTRAHTPSHMNKPHRHLHTWVNNRLSLYTWHPRMKQWEGRQGDQAWELS